MSSLASRIVLDTAHPERYAAYLGHLCRSLYVRVSLEKNPHKVVCHYLFARERYLSGGIDEVCVLEF